MKIGIIGSGNMGRAIGVRLHQLGYEVCFGARRLDQAKSAAAIAGKEASHGSNDDAARYGDILLWTIRISDPSDILTNVNELDDKIIVDLNNRDYANDVKNGAWFEKAIAEELQLAAPKSRVVKALNTIAMEAFDTNTEALKAAGAQTFIAGDDDEAKAAVSQLVRRLGFEPVDLGAGSASMRAAEALGDVIRLLMIDGGLGGRAHIVTKQLPEPNLSIIGNREDSNYH